MHLQSLCAVTVMVLYSLGTSIVAHAGQLPVTPNPNAGAGTVIVRGQFDGDIFGFDVDPNGTEGLLCEAVSNSDGSIHAAVETFDQLTGAITSVVAESDTQADFVALGVFGHSSGLVESENPLSLFHVKRRFSTMIPLEAHQLNGRWTPPLDRNHVINQVKAGQSDSSDVAVYAVDVSTAATPVIFTSNLETNTFGGVIPITDPIFTSEAPPVIAYDNERNQVILGHDFPSAFIVPPRIGFVNLATGKLTMQKGMGLGVVNGIAVDSEDGILCTDTSADSGVQFYDLVNRTAQHEYLPGRQRDSNIANGADIAFDQVNKLFLVAQTFSGTATSGSSIQVYDIQGNFVESVDGLDFQGGFDVFPTHISINPNTRTGFVQGPDLTTSIQSFTY